MAGYWIKIERDLPHKPEVMRIAEILDVDELQVVGHLVLFWSWCDANMSLDCPDVIGTKRGLDRAACRDGMVDALVEVGWLQLISENGQDKFRIPNFERHLSKSAKTRVIEQQKKQRQRRCPDAKGTIVPPQQGTLPGLEERRGEESKTTGGPPSEVLIPSKLNDPECLAAAEKWFDYLDSKGLQEKNPRWNEPQRQEWWMQMARLGREGFVEAVGQSIAAGLWNIRLDDRKLASSKKRQSPEWIATIKAAHAFPEDWQKRKELLGDELFEALKRTGSRQVATANDFELQNLKDIFESHLKDIRSGSKTSN